MVSLRPIVPEDRERMLDILTSDKVNKTYMLPDFETKEDATAYRCTLKTPRNNFPAG